MRAEQAAMLADSPVDESSHTPEHLCLRPLALGMLVFGYFSELRNTCHTTAVRSRGLFQIRLAAIADTHPRATSE